MNEQPGLVVSVDQVGMLRATRGSDEPDPAHFAMQAELAGALGIRAHLRIDRAYMNEQDMELLSRMVKTHFYLQISPHQDVVHLINTLRPHNVVMCAERRDDRAGESGLDATLLAKELAGIIKNVDTRQTKVFLFVDPDFDQIKTAAKLNVQGLLLNVRDLMLDPLPLNAQKRFNNLKNSMKLGFKYGLEMHLAGGVTAQRFRQLASIPGLSRIHVGHQLIARSLQLGVLDAVRSYLHLLT